MGAKHFAAPSRGSEGTVTGRRCDPFRHRYPPPIAVSGGSIRGATSRSPPNSLWSCSSNRLGSGTHLCACVKASCCRASRRPRTRRSGVHEPHEPPARSPLRPPAPIVDHRQDRRRGPRSLRRSHRPLSRARSGRAAPQPNRLTPEPVAPVPGGASGCGTHTQGGRCRPS